MGNNASFKLYYFGFRFRGEVIRLVFTAAGKEFEDVRIDPSQWPQLKNQAPFGTLPYLEVTSGSQKLVLTQSTSIARYLAKKFKLAGRNDEEAAIVDMYADQVSDVLAEFAKTARESDANKKKEIEQKIENEIMPKNLKLFEARIAESRSGYLVPSGLTWADLYLFNLLEMLGEKRVMVLEAFPNLKGLDQKIRNNPRMAAYLAKRPITPF
uniref:Glutathione S-transferase S4 n=1 Tax=Brachionus calyciflorus TaxID=104777 RepID=A0A3G2JSQ7_9BILA|nr:glutathione S-transferase S4 [Brachionus calyciflorus]